MWDGNTLVWPLMAIAIDDVVHHEEEGVCVHILCLTHFFDGLVAKAQIDAESAHGLQHAVVVADEGNHLVVRLVKLHFLHVERIIFYCL